MQNWLRIHDYAKQYLEWTYKTYSSHSPAYLCTYYNLDLPNSVYDGNILDAGSYEKTGNRSGLKWRKILLLPVYGIEQIQPTKSAEEDGVTMKTQMTSFNFPTEYYIKPMAHDYIKFEQDILKPTNNQYPLYQVTNIEKATNTDKSFWKVQCQVDYRQEEDLENHLSQLCVFFDYNKKIYNIQTATTLYKLLEKNRSLQDMKKYFEVNGGYYFNG